MKSRTDYFDEALDMNAEKINKKDKVENFYYNQKYFIIFFYFIN